MKRRSVVPAVCIALAALGAPRAFPEGSPPPLLADASFEEGAKTPAAAWQLSEGATDGGTGQKSEVAIDRETFRHGSASMRLSGSMGTTSWQLVRQRVAVAAGDRMTLRGALRTMNVRREGRQYPNANLLVEFVDAKGERVNLAWSQPMPATHEWTDVTITTIVPERTAAAWVGAFLSQSGTMWCDDLRLTVAPASGADAAGREAALDVIESHLRATYPFFGMARRPKADALFATWRPRCLAAKDEPEFVEAVRRMLGELDDLHVWMRRGGKAVATGYPSAVVPNIDVAARNAALTETLDATAPLVVGRIASAAGPVGYVEVQTWQLDAAAAARLDAAIDSLADCRALVLDVRRNTGGDESVAQKVMSRFAAEETVYARSQVRDPFSPSPDAFLPPTERRLAPRSGAKPDARPVAVLQGKACMSSCEGFLLMARALPNVTTLGATSRGASANPRPLQVFPDLSIWSSTWRAYPPEGECIEGVGVPAEVEVKSSPKGTDGVLAEALKILSK